MKKSELPKFIAGIGPCLLGEYRGSLVEKRGWVDKEDGEKKTYIAVVHQFEYGSGQRLRQIGVKEYAPHASEPGDVKVTFKRGKTYLMLLLALETFKGQLSGKLDLTFEPLEIEEG